MIVRRIPLEQFGSNAYVVGNEETGTGVVIDPGAKAPEILQTVRELGLNVPYIFNTHGHFDHVGANAEVKSATGAQVLIHRLDAPMLGGSGSGAFDREVDDGEEIELEGLTMKVLHTPGHTPGGICLLVGACLFTGDTIFRRTVGGTVAAGGFYTDILRSIKEKVLTLPDDTVLYPGHAGPTTVGEERKHNRFLTPIVDRLKEGDRVRYRGSQEVMLVVYAEDHDGGYKALVRYDNGTEDIVPGSALTSL